MIAALAHVRSEGEAVDPSPKLTTGGLVIEVSETHAMEAED